ncbi:hypothetical protein [Marinobacter nauticus]|uniref:hypothetical protein n=1 Tax=Marinobacter nauticus TaxID=2743 RepID=UPI001C99E3BA|nr:hypothetical protein [Marinobacter nauticus]MBY5961342.1 hypothetical protein [Marinobacter nauticus]
MKIVYLAKISTKDGEGVNKKIAAQISAWRSLGVVVCPVFIAKDDRIPAELKRVAPKLIVQRKITSFYIRDCEVEKTVEEFCPNLVYFRMGSFPFFSVFKVFSFPVILEVNTKVYNELKVSYSGLKYYILKFLFNVILRKASGYVGVTMECLVGLPERPSFQVGNSIDFDRNFFQDVVRERVPNSACVFVGSSGCSWHGVDRLLEIARFNPEYTFRIVGYSKEDVEEISGNRVPDNVEVFGFLTGDPYQRLLRDSTIAFGSLAMDRNGMEYSSSLKNRDYLQFGLPIIMQGRDSDLSTLECIFELPMDFDVLDVGKVLRNAAVVDLKAEMSYLIERAIDARKVESRRVRFFESFLIK